MVSLDLFRQEISPNMKIFHEMNEKCHILTQIYSSVKGER
jgi:hypothetical protein